jgi:hypothetical protein
LARIRLELPVTGWQEFVDGQGGRAHYGWIRFPGQLFVGRARLQRECVIDTGAALSVFSEQEWRQFEDEIEWLTTPPGGPRTGWWSTLRGMTGDPVPCRLGRVAVTPIDLDGRRLAPTAVVAQFAEDGDRIRRILMGLGHGILEGRRLVVEPDLRQAWLEDR